MEERHAPHHPICTQPPGGYIGQSKTGASAGNRITMGIDIRFGVIDAVKKGRPVDLPYNLLI